MRSMYRDYVHNDSPPKHVTVIPYHSRGSDKSSRDIVFDAFLKSQPVEVREQLRDLKGGVSGRHMKRIMGRLAALERTNGGGTQRKK